MTTYELSASQRSAATARPLAPDRAAERVHRIGRDPEALESLYHAHFDDLVAYFARRGGSPHDVADLVAETFLRAVAGAARYESRAGTPVAWLFGIARNVLREHRRADAVQAGKLRRLAGRRLLDAEDIARLEERIDAERAAQRLLGDLDRLTESQRELVELVDLAGLTPAEAAAALNVTAGTARIRLHRAHKTLRAAADQRGRD